MIKLVKEHAVALEMGKKGRNWMIKNRSYAHQAEALEKRYFQLLKEFYLFNHR
jgi:hypothetical protein